MSSNFTGELLTRVRAGTLRVLGILGDQTSEFLPEVQTLKAHACGSVSVGAIVYVDLSAPAGVPAKAVERLTGGLHKAMTDETVKTRMYTLGNTLESLFPQESGAFWGEHDAKLKPLIEAAKQQGK